MSTNRSSSGVRNLRAMFEGNNNHVNHNDGPTSPEPRGRSPALSEGNGVNGGRPISKVRASFVSVEKSGEMGAQLGLKKDHGEGEGSLAQRRSSFYANDQKNPEAIIEAKETVEKELERRKSVAPTSPVPEMAILPTPAATPAIEPTEANVMFGKQAEDAPASAKPAAADKAPEEIALPGESTPKANPDKPTATVDESVSLLPSDTKDEAAVSGGAALSEKSEDLRESPKEVTSTSASTTAAPTTETQSSEPTKADEAPSTLGAATDGANEKSAGDAQAKPAASTEKLTERRPTAIHVSKEGSPSKPSSNSSSAKAKPPKTPTSPTKSSTTNKKPAPSKPASTTTAEPHKAPVKKPSRASVAPTSTAASAPKPRVSTVAPSHNVAKKPTPAGHSHDAARRPRSPTKPVRVPAAALAPTASSAAKTGPTSRSPSRTGSALGGRETLAHRPKPAVAASKAPTVRKPASRASLPAQHAPAPERPRSRVSTAGSGEGFLARMMRPTASSASKTHDKVEPKTSPKRAPSVKLAKRKSGEPAGEKPTIKHEEADKETETSNGVRPIKEEEPVVEEQIEKADPTPQPNGKAEASEPAGETSEGVEVH
ncbi:MAG: hypothetical protein M1819_005210 [Sarea resinae]|nr:MAG: hypothetical protein M1819_005210 [Sarea resinae]